MKRIIALSLVVSTAFYACNGGDNPRLPLNAAQMEKDTAHYTTIQWLDSIKNFGTAKYGDKINIEYSFKNTGDKPLYLLDVRPTCGCTIADYTKSAVMPGKEGYVKATYDSHHGTPGNVRKSIVVTSNTKNDTHFVLAFTGDVVK